MINVDYFSVLLRYYRPVERANLDANRMLQIKAGYKLFASFQLLFAFPLPPQLFDSIIPDCYDLKEDGLVGRIRQR